MVVGHEAPLDLQVGLKQHLNNHANNVLNPAENSLRLGGRRRCGLEAVDDYSSVRSHVDSGRQ